MKKVDDWFGLFIATHMMRFPREDWPEEMSEEASNFFGAWRHQFIIKGLTEDVATKASLDLAGDPPRWLADHLPAILKAGAEVRRQAEPQTSAESPLEDARMASRDCPDCLGNGSAVRYVHPEILGKLKTSAGNPVPIGGSVSIPCSCPLGRHVARGLAPEGRQPVPTVDRYPSLRRWEAPWGSPSSDGLDNQFRYRPSEWDAALECPRLTPIHDLATLKAITTSVKDHSVALERRSQLAAMDRAPASEVAPEAKPGRPLTIPEDNAVEGWF